MENIYAQALWRMVSEKGKTAHEAVDGLRTLLKKHGREILLPRISKAFERLAQRELLRTKMTLSIARHSDEHHAKAEAKKVMEQLKLDVKNLEVHIDENLIGGWRLEGGEYLVDNTYVRHLLRLYKNVTDESPDASVGIPTQ